VDGVVVKEIKGGYEVRLAGGARAFCPHSQMDLPRSGGQGEHVGKRAAFRITKYGEKGRNIVVSRRALLEEEEERKTREVMATLTEGMVMKGTVTAVREFGAFVSIGPVEGLIPISEIGWERVEDIQSVLSVGQEVEVAITRLDWANRRFSFSLKKTLADPWETAVDRFPAGSRHVGKVARLAAFGAFVSLGGGVDGLLHISKLGGGKRIRSAGEVLRAGQEIEVRVDSVDPVKRRIALSLPAAESTETLEEEAEDYSKYMEQPPAPPALGSLGEALKAKMERKGK
jgi:small subunit ribosomal protein S1